VGVLLEQAASVFLDDGVQVLGCASDSVERVWGRGTSVVRNRSVVQNFKQDLGRQVVKRRHGARWRHRC
jgi:hypothetical protein